MKALLVLAVLASVAHADDRKACDSGDRKACVRIGRLKQMGALKADGSRDVDVIISTCGKELDGATKPDSLRSVGRGCSLLFNAELQKAWEALAVVDGPDVAPLLATGYAESYCPLLPKPVTGCTGKRAANFSSQKPAQVRAALAALNAAALAKELGADKAKPLAAKFAAAWPRLFPD